MKKMVTVLCLVLVAVFAFAACSSPAPAESSSEAPAESSSEAPAESSEAPAESTDAPSESAEESPAAGGGGTHALITKSTGNPFMERMASGFETAITELGGTAIVRDPAEPTAEAQIQIIDELVAQNVNSITIDANDADALQPAAQKAMDAGIAVLCADSSANAESRKVFCNQAGVTEVAQSLCDAVLDLTGGEGEWAILSATSQAANQNAWIAAMEDIMAGDEKYANLELVKTAYGDDLRDKSTSETEGLLQSYPDLKCIVAPTTVGIAAAGKVLTDKDLAGVVQLTGLGLPSEMAEYIDNGVCPYMFLWNPIDLGYMAGYTANALATGEITGAAGESFESGTLGMKEIVDAADGGTEIILGPPFEFNAENIAEWKDVY